jgi:hypothetical protein
VEARAGDAEQPTEQRDGVGLLHRDGSRSPSTASARSPTRALFGEHARRAARYRAGRG